MTQNILSPHPINTDKTPLATNDSKPNPLQVIGPIADEISAQSVFEKYKLGKAHSTIERHSRSLRLFGEFLLAAAEELNLQNPEEMNLSFDSDPAAWKHITWGMAEAFKTWMLNEGYAIGTINNRLDAIRVFAELAMQAGVLSNETLAQIRSVKGIGYKHGINVDKHRKKEEKKTRVGSKKVEATFIADYEAELLRTKHDNNPAGRRNKLIINLLLDHGLRASEVVLLEKKSFNLERNEMRFYRPKTERWNVHQMMPTTREALLAYMQFLPAEGPIFLSSKRNGELRTSYLTRVTLSALVSRLGIGIVDGPLSPHDFRHRLATEMARKGYTLKELMDWFGWDSPSMAVRYIQDAAVSVRNKG